MRKTGVIIAAAGSSTRMDSGPKKEYRALGKKTVIQHSVAPFLQIESLYSIVLAISKGQEEKMRLALGDVAFNEHVRYVEGGATRQESVYKALQVMKNDAPDIVLIHDGARPWVTASVIRRVEEAAYSHGAAAPGVIPADAMKNVDGKMNIKTHLKRTDLVAVQTPQGFLYADILAAHEKAQKDGREYLDDTEVYWQYKGKVKVIEGDPKNRKITFAHDVGGIS